MDIMDLFDFFEEYDVEYWTSGKNVTQGWVNIQCPYCEDGSNHLGIRKKDLLVNCWICGRHRVINLIKTLSDLTYSEAKTISTTLGGSDTNPPAEPASSLFSARVRLPQGHLKRLPLTHREYLIERGFPPSKIRKLIKKYKLLACYTTGKYRFRIIIPIILNRKIVSFTSRAIGNIEPPYMHATPEESAIPPKNLVYNIDSVTTGSDAILVEGPIDVWKLGDNTISILGVQHTEAQIVAIKRKEIRNLFIFFDSDRAGEKEAKKISRILAPLVENTEIVTLTNLHDPGELKIEEGELIKKQLGII